MKVQFMKKLVPLALITSIAVTNVGITSVAAQTPTNAITQSVEGPVAVENESVSVGTEATTTPVYVSEDQVDAIKIAESSPVTVTFKYTSPYGGDGTVSDDVVGEASATIDKEIDSTLYDSGEGVRAESFDGKGTAFYLAKESNGATPVDTKDYTIEMYRRSASSAADDTGEVKFKIYAKYKVAKAPAGGGDNALYLMAKTGESTNAMVAKILAVANVADKDPEQYQENTKGVVGKYAIEQTNDGVVSAPEAYNLVFYKAFIKSDGTPVYPGEMQTAEPTAYEALPDEAKNSEYAKKTIRALTAKEAGNLPYTTAKAATKAEYDALGAGETLSGGMSKAYYTANFATNTNTEIQRILKEAGDAFAAGDDVDGTDKHTAYVAAVGIIDKIIAALGEDETTALTSAAKTVVAAGKTDEAAENPTAAITTAVEAARKKAFFNYMKTSGTVTDTETLLINSEDTVSFGGKQVAGVNDGQILTNLKDLLTDTEWTEFSSWLAETQSKLDGGKSTWYYLKNKSYVTGSDWEEETDVSDYMKLAMETIIAKELDGDTSNSTYTKTATTYLDGALKTEAENNLLATTYAHKKQLDTASINWITETVNAKGDLASGAGFAKFAVTKNDKTSFAAKTTGDSVIVGATKANKQTNSYVIVKAVSKNYKAATAKTAQKGDVYAQAEFYVTPVASTGFTDKSLSTTAEKPGITFSAPDAATPLTYELKLDEGKSYKLPFALKDGADKTLVYDVTSNAKGFTVVNGTVKAIAGGGSGDIYVYPKTVDATTAIAVAEAGTTDLDKTTAVKIHVTTNSAIKTVKATSNNVTMYPGSKQWITFSSNPATDAAGLKYTVTGLDKYDVAWVNAVGSETAVTVDNGTKVGNVLFIKSKDNALTEGNTPDKTTKATVKLEKWDATTSAFVEAGTKDFTLNVKWAGAGANAKTVKETYKKVNSDGVVEINVPVGGVVNLGASVNPATADQSIKYLTAKDAEVALSGSSTKVTVSAVDALNNANDSSWNSLALEDGTGAGVDTADNAKLKYEATALAGGELTMTGDVIKANIPGTYYVKGWTAAKNEKGKNLTTNIYKINVYTPGASIIMNDERDTNKYDIDANTVMSAASTPAPITGVAPLTKDKTYTIVGGNLMTKAAAETDGNKVIMGGQTIEIAEPYTLGTSEEIEWKCNKPSAIRITRVKEGYHLVNTLGTGANTRSDDTIKSTLKLDLMQAGTFTITGTTKYTKQKFVFKVNVGGDATVKRDQTPTCEKFYFDYNGTAVDLLNGGSPVTDGATKMKVKDTASVGFFTNKAGLNGTVKYEAVDKKVLNVAANGTVKALAKGSTAIKATFTSADKKTTFTVTSPKITVEPQTATISKFTIPSGVSIGKDFNVSAAIKDAKIADCDVKWEYIKLTGVAAGEAMTDDEAVKQSPAGIATSATWASWSLGNKPSGKVKLTDKGVYLVRLTVSPKNDTSGANDVVEWGVLEAFEKTPTIVNVNNNDADAKKAIAALAAAPKANEDGEGTTGGAGYGVYIIPVFAADKDGNLTAANVGDIEWTSSNVSLATATAITDTDLANAKANMKTYLDTANAKSGSAADTNPDNGFKVKVEEENAIVKSAANAAGLVKIVTASANSGLTGKVTLTGVLKNSGKKVTVTLNIKNEEKKVVDKYNPIGVTKGLDSSALTASNGFQNIVALKGDEYDKEAVNKLKKGATYTYYAYALVDTTDAKLLKAKPADHIKAINTAGADAQDMLVYTKVDDKYNVSSIKKEAYANADNGDTYYLAQVAVSVKVKTAAELDEDGSVKTGGDAVLETTPTKQVITIASQTPVIIKSST